MVMASGVEFVESPNEGVLFREVSVQSSAVARVGHGDVCLSPASSLKTRWYCDKGCRKGQGRDSQRARRGDCFLSHILRLILSHPLTLLEAGFRHSPSQTLSLSNDSDGLAMRMALLGIT